MNAHKLLVVSAAALLFVPVLAEARPNRPSAGSGINRPNGNVGGITQPNRPNRPGGGNQIGNNTNVNVNVDNRNHGGYHGGYDNGYNHHHDVWNAVGTAAAVTATVAVTSAIIGSMTYTRPSDCVTIFANGISYLQCGSNWYEPQYVGSQVRYVVVVRPRY